MIISLTLLMAETSRILRQYNGHDIVCWLWMAHRSMISQTSEFFYH
jgi:hypothetical protein